MRVLVETVHIVIGLAACALIAGTAAWAYPLARREIEITGLVVGIVVVLLGIRPLVRAYRADREHMDQ